MIANTKWFIVGETSNIWRVTMHNMDEMWSQQSILMLRGFDCYFMRLSWDLLWRLGLSDKCGSS